jgi:hypothetical protein
MIGFSGIISAMYILSESSIILYPFKKSSPLKLTP